MSNFEDGSYGSLAGISLIGKILAGRCQMRYTRAAVGKGTIPNGMTPKTMVSPPDYVMDAMIANVTTPVGGECQVTVQIRSDDVETGFYITSIILYAEDPDEGEVPYTYLCLENGPEWIWPASSAVGKFATFDLIAAVGDVDAVNAVINPEAVATKEDIESLEVKKADVSLSQPATLQAGSWEGEEAPYTYTLMVEGVTDTNNIEVLPPPELTREQFDSMADALIVGGRQGDGHIQLVAWGERPGVDLPVVIIVRGD